MNGNTVALCQNCGQRPGTEAWCAEGVIAAVHGLTSLWCKVCVLQAQLQHAREMVARIPELEAALKQAEGQ